MSAVLSHGTESTYGHLMKDLLFHTHSSCVPVQPCSLLLGLEHVNLAGNGMDSSKNTNVKYVLKHFMSQCKATLVVAFQSHCLIVWLISFIR